MVLPILSALLLGLLTIIDPCTLFTSIAAIGYIDKEIANRRLVLLNGLLFVLGKLLTYFLISLPFLMGARTEWMQELLEHWGEPITAAFLLICGVIMLIGGHFHHEHDHGISHWLSVEHLDNKNSLFWSFMLGIFFAIAFCPHRLVYFATMIDMAIDLPSTTGWILPIVFGLGTGLPVMIIAWLLSYSVVEIGKLRKNLHTFETWFRHICAILFIALGVYMTIHIFTHDHDHEHTQLSLPAVCSLA